MADNDQQNQQPIQMTLPELVFLLQTIIGHIEPLHLSRSCSINLADVSVYEEIEELDDKDKPTGKTVPSIVMTSGERLVLTEEQKEVFRPEWEAYARLAHQKRAIASQLFPPADDVEDKTENEQ